MARELREAGYVRLAAVSRAELACLDTQFDRLASPPPEAAPSALAHDFALRALDPAIEAALASDDKLFLLVATDVLARRDLPPALELAPHLTARLAPLAAAGLPLANVALCADALGATALGRAITDVATRPGLRVALRDAGRNYVATQHSSARFSGALDEVLDHARDRFAHRRNRAGSRTSTPRAARHHPLGEPP